MNINQLYFVLVACVLALAGCRKIEPPVIADPELPNFEVALDVEGSLLNLIAGDRNYYMNTSWEIDDNNVHTFIGNIAQYDCLDQCEEQLTIKIRDYQQTETPLVDIIGALPLNQSFAYQVDSVIIGTPDTTTWIIEANTNLDHNSTQFSWTVNGNTQTVFDTSFIYSSTTENRIEVGLLVTSDTLFNSIYTNRFFGAPNSPNGLGVAINVSPAVQGTLSLEAEASGGVQPYVYAWNNGNNNNSIMNNFQIDEYCVTVTDSNLDTTSTCIVFENQNIQAPEYYYGNITASSITNPGQMAEGSNPFRLGIVTIEYTDANGIFYSTELGAQASNANFAISEVNEYDQNTENEAVKQLLLSFECDVYRETGQQLSISSIDALFGIAYPE